MGPKTNFPDLLGKLGQNGTITLLKDPNPNPDPSPATLPLCLTPAIALTRTLSHKDFREALVKAEAANKAREPNP